MQTRTLAMSAAVGALVGLAVAGFGRLVDGLMLEHLRDLPLVAIALMPAVGLAVAWAALSRLGRGASPATADAYIESFHDEATAARELAPRALLARVVAAVATLGCGGALGLEGPSLYIGAALGALGVRALAARRLWPADPVAARNVTVAGAAAGVAAIFKAPATGAVFALEVPFRDDFARRALMPALVGAAGGYLVFAAINGTDPLFPIAGAPSLAMVDLVGAVVLGGAAGLVARGFAAALLASKRWAGSTAPMLRWAVAAVGLAGLAFASEAVAERPFTIGPGADVVRWAAEPGHAAGVVAALLIMRAAASCLTLAGGGVGGVFIPLVVTGALLGRLVGGAFDALDTSLFIVIGIAAVLGAGYRVPLAAVVFVAETTGRPGFIVPGLLAAVAADLVMGEVSVTAYQREA